MKANLSRRALMKPVGMANTRINAAKNRHVDKYEVSGVDGG